jgi:hypothetical protein
MRMATTMTKTGTAILNKWVSLQVRGRMSYQKIEMFFV